MRKIGIKLAKQQSNPRKGTYARCSPEIAPIWKGRGVCKFIFLILIHKIIVHMYIKYLLSVFPTLEII